ncbi:MAG: class I SAM-dependent methyltransferase [Deferrisomatales bacterium]|nr:class I SAM-dependent methyltransferase [Deferrisomatales bacterium]
MFQPAKLPAPLKKLARSFTQPRVPKEISARYRDISPSGMRAIEASLRQHYFTTSDTCHDNNYLSSDQGRADLEAHLHRRVDKFRNTVIPWLDDARSLKGAKILEIGCGTGSSTVALAEQGAVVTAVDIVESSLNVARDRCNVYDVSADFICANATEVHKICKSNDFDFIIFFAALEHMIHHERMIAMKNTWDMLSPGNLWCVMRTPNRLWYYDGHTSRLPFYLWLPDDLAFSYSRFSPRKPFGDLYREMNEESKLDFLRRGRGVSFHEFELTMKRAEDLDVVSSLPLFLRNQHILNLAVWSLTGQRRFESDLIRVGPKIHRGFYQGSLDLIIRKD